MPLFQTATTVGDICSLGTDETSLSSLLSSVEQRPLGLTFNLMLCHNQSESSCSDDYSRSIHQIPYEEDSSTNPETAPYRQCGSYSTTSRDADETTSSVAGYARSVKKDLTINFDEPLDTEPCRPVFPCQDLFIYLFI